MLRGGSGLLGCSSLALLLLRRSRPGFLLWCIYTGLFLVHFVSAACNLELLLLHVGLWILHSSIVFLMISLRHDGRVFRLEFLFIDTINAFTHLIIVTRPLLSLLRLLLFLCLLVGVGLSVQGPCLLYLLTLRAFIIVLLSDLTIAAFEHHRLAANTRVDVESDWFVHGCIFISLTAVISCCVHIIFPSCCLDHVQIARLVLFTAEVFDLGCQARHIVELKLPLWASLVPTGLLGDRGCILGFFGVLVIKAVIVGLVFLCRRPVHLHRNELE